MHRGLLSRTPVGERGSSLPPLIPLPSRRPRPIRAVRAGRRRRRRQRRRERAGGGVRRGAASPGPRGGGYAHGWTLAPIAFPAALARRGERSGSDCAQGRPPAGPSLARQWTAGLARRRNAAAAAASEAAAAAVGVAKCRCLCTPSAAGCCEPAPGAAAKPGPRRNYPPRWCWAAPCKRGRRARPRRGAMCVPGRHP